MRGFIDLHCHWIAAIDDGAKTTDESLAMLRGLRQAGFDQVVATPHMRPGMFDNDRPALERAFAAMHPVGEALPYPGNGKCVLVEVGQGAFPARLQHRFFDVKRAGYTPVLAHPERYDPVWKDDTCLDPLLDAGAHLLLDVCSLVGKYGRAPQKAAEKLLEDDAYEEAMRLLSTGPRGILEGRPRDT